MPDLPIRSASRQRPAGLGTVPPQLGILTIQQIIALIGPPPPQAYAPLISINFRIF